MPHTWRNKIVVTVNELVPTWWANYNALKLQVYRHKDLGFGIKRVQKGGKNHPSLYDFDSLPKEIQLALGDPRKVDNILENYYKVDDSAITFYADFQRPGYGFMKSEEQERYIINASVLQAVVSLEVDRINDRLSKRGSLRSTTHNGHRTPSVPESLYNDAMDFNNVLKAKHDGIQHTLPSNQRRFTAALNNFKKDSYVSLVKDAEGKSLKNASRVCTKTNEFLNNLFAGQKHKPTATEIHRQYDAFLDGYIEVINNTTGEVYNPKEYKKLSDGSVKAYLSKWKNKIGTHAARSGDRQKYMSAFKPHHSMHLPKYAGSLLSIDDRQPPFYYEKSERVWFYIGTDVASGAWTVWVHGKSKKGIILDFYRQLVRNYHEWGLHLPWELECESSLNSSFKNTFLREGQMFQKVRIEANNARGKIIENRFGSDLRYNGEKKMEGWVARPHAISESNQAGPAKKMIKPYETIVNDVIDNLVDLNNTAHKDTKKHKGKTRWEVFMENQHPDLKPTNYKAILPHIGYTTKTSCNAGITKLQYGEYLLAVNGEIALSETLIDLMDKVEGKEFMVYWLDDNYGEVFKAHLYLEDRFICELMPTPKYNRSQLEQTKEDLASRTLMSSYVATIESYGRKQKNNLDKVTIIDNRSTTLNNKFVAPGTKQRKKEKYIERQVETLENFIDEEEENHNYVPASNTGSSWRDSFYK